MRSTKLMPRVNFTFAMQKKELSVLVIVAFHTVGQQKMAKTKSQNHKPLDYNACIVLLLSQRRQIRDGVANISIFSKLCAMAQQPTKKHSKMVRDEYQQIANELPNNRKISTATR